MVRAVQRVRDGSAADIGNFAALDDVVAAFNPTEGAKGKTIIRFVRKDAETTQTPVTS